MGSRLAMLWPHDTRTAVNLNTPVISKHRGFGEAGDNATAVAAASGHTRPPCCRRCCDVYRRRYYCNNVYHTEVSLDTWDSRGREGGAPTDGRHSAYLGAIGT